MILPFIPALIAGASFLLSAGSAIAEHKAEQDRADANRRAAREARQRGMADLSIRAIQEDRAAANRADRVRRETRERSGTARASAAASGVRPTDLLLGDLEASSGEALSLIEQNLRLQDLQIGRQREAVVAQERARVRQVPEPSGLATGLRIGAAALQLGQDLNRPEPAGTETEQ